MGCSKEPAPVSFFYFLLNIFSLSFLRCLEHVVNLANVAVMEHITKIAVVENTNAIWEYDPALPGNRVLEGSLDVVAALRTLVVKVSSSIIGPIVLTFLCDRFNLRDSASSTLRKCSSKARSRSHSRFHSTTIHDGAQHIRCSTAHTTYAR
jgi:hypothetical protein